MVFKESGKEEIIVIPNHWVKDKVLFWPDVRMKRAIEEWMSPTDEWSRYPLISVKVTGGMSLTHFMVTDV